MPRESLTHNLSRARKSPFSRGSGETHQIILENLCEFSVFSRTKLQARIEDLKAYQIVLEKQSQIATAKKFDKRVLSCRKDPLSSLLNRDGTARYGTQKQEEPSTRDNGASSSLPAVLNKSVSDGFEVESVCETVVP